MLWNSCWVCPDGGARELSSLPTALFPLPFPTFRFRPLFVEPTFITSPLTLLPWFLPAGFIGHKITGIWALVDHTELPAPIALPSGGISLSDRLDRGRPRDEERVLVEELPTVSPQRSFYRLLDIQTTLLVMFLWWRWWFVWNAECVPFQTMGATGGSFFS